MHEITSISKATLSSIYIVSTPWNLLNAIVLASRKRGDEQAYLLLVDQTEKSKSFYSKHLESWVGSPFLGAWFFAGKKSSLLEKYKQRRRTLAEISQIVRRISPHKIYTGNDRRIEFQRAMTESLLQKNSAIGVYLDDGLFSYSVDSFKKGLVGGKLSSFFMRLFYGVVWKHPVTVGASEWIHESWVLSPEKANRLIKENSKLYRLDVSWYCGDEMKSFLLKLIAGEKFLGLSASYDVLLLLPNRKNVSGFEWQKIRAWLGALSGTNLKLLVKRHPKDEEGIADIIPNDIEFFELPKGLAFEFLIPFLDVKMVVGGRSTASLTAAIIGGSRLVEFTELGGVAA